MSNNIIYPWTDVEAADPEFVVKKVRLWRSSFWAWYCDCVWTTDESDSANPVKRAPQYRYLYEQVAIEDESKITVVCKSRRMFETHFQYARILWTFLFVPFSKNLIVSKKENDVKDGLRSRILAMYYRLDKRFPCHIELRPRKDIHELEILHPDKNFGSHILGLPSGADQMRSYTATRVLVDEFAFHDKQSQRLTMDALKPAIYGASGRAVILSTPCPDTTFEQLVTDMNTDVPMRSVMAGMTVGTNKLNQTVIYLHYSADPYKRTKEWMYQERYGTTVDGVPIKGCSGVDEYTWRKEYELSFDFPTGSPVIPEFRKELHCAAYATHGGVIKNKPLEIGIDFGSNFPAVVFAQVDSLNRCIIHGGIMPEKMNLDRFMMRIDDEIKSKYSECDGFNLYCDPAGASGNSQGTAPPAAQALYEYFKKIPKYKLTKPSDRARAIRKQAAMLVGGVPGLIVNPHAGLYISPDGSKEQSGIIPKALEIGWVYDDNRKDKLEPKKDGFYDHLMDAFGYMFIFKYPSLFRDEQSRKPIMRKLSSWVLRR